ncbi:MAG: hypothetical protein IKG46_12175 [Solobacterium sp.]|nr:hypothetical protein [Solobacterium sp.]
MKTEKLTIRLHERQNALLAGNGICQSIGMNSCYGIIEEIRKEKNPAADPEVLEKLQFPHQIVAATNDHVDENMKRLTQGMLKAEYSEEDTEFLKDLLDHMPEFILTANYSTELESAAFGRYTAFTYRTNTWKSAEMRGSADSLGLNRYTMIPVGERQKQVWHIHGNAMKPTSIVMGHYYYGKLLREIEEYIPVFLKNYKMAVSKGEQEIAVRSWVDLFMLCDVHILGFSMDPAEMDLWWLLCCKKRHFPETQVYFYEPDPARITNSGKELLMKAYGANIITTPDFTGDYRQYYRDTIRMIGGNRNE